MSLYLNWLGTYTQICPTHRAERNSKNMSQLVAAVRLLGIPDTVCTEGPFQKQMKCPRAVYWGRYGKHALNTLNELNPTRREGIRSWRQVQVLPLSETHTLTVVVFFYLISNQMAFMSQAICVMWVNPSVSGAFSRPTSCIWTGTLLFIVDTRLQRVVSLWSKAGQYARRSPLRDTHLENRGWVVVRVYWWQSADGERIPEKRIRQLHPTVCSSSWKKRFIWDRIYQTGYFSFRRYFPLCFGVRSCR